MDNSDKAKMKRHNWMLWELLNGSDKLCTKCRYFWIARNSSSSIKYALLRSVYDHFQWFACMFFACSLRKKWVSIQSFLFVCCFYSLHCLVLFCLWCVAHKWTRIQSVHTKVPLYEIAETRHKSACNVRVPCGVCLWHIPKAMLIAWTGNSVHELFTWFASLFNALGATIYSIRTDEG